MAFDISNPIGTGTDQELLDFTRAAIAEVTLHGQSRSQSGRMVTMADLPQLWDQVKLLEARIDAETTGSAKNFVTKRRPL